MDIDYKNISLVVGAASALLGLLYKLLPNRSDRLKKDMELLKLAKETEANHLPLLRRVNSQIYEEYVHEELGRKEKVEIIFKNVSGAVYLSVAFLGLFGVVVSSIARAIFELTDEKAGLIIGTFVGLGVLTGFYGGFSDANKEIEVLENEIDKRVRERVEKDELELKEDEKNAIILGSANANKGRSA